MPSMIPSSQETSPSPAPRRLVPIRGEEFYEKIRLVYAFVTRARFPLLVAITSSFLWLSVEQGREILRALAEPAPYRIKYEVIPYGERIAWSDFDWGMLFGFILFLLLLSLQSWGWTRLIFAYRFNRQSQELNSYERRAERDIPSICGALPLVAVGAGFVSNAYTFVPSPWWLGLFSTIGVLGCIMCLPLLAIILRPNTTKPRAVHERSGHLNLGLNVILGTFAILAIWATIMSPHKVHAGIGAIIIFLAWAIFGLEWPWCVLIMAAGAFTGFFVEAGTIQQKLDCVAAGVCLLTLGILLLWFQYRWRSRHGLFAWDFPCPSRDRSVGMRRPVLGYTQERLDIPLRKLLRPRLGGVLVHKGTCRFAWSLAVMGLMNVAGLITFSVCGPGFCWWMTTGSILCVGFATWIALGSAVVIVLRSTQAPVMLLAMVLAILFSGVRDSHPVRVADFPRPSPAAGVYADTLAAFDRWQQQFGPSDEKSPRRPCFVVAAEGGGIRAAYWTALVLGRLQELSAEASPSQVAESSHDFFSHCFGISGVSGGSLGGALFCVLQSDSLVEQPNLPVGERRSRLITTAAHRILIEDHLSAPVAKAMFPEVLAQLWPWQIPAIDRGRALEKSWEKAFTDYSGRNTTNWFAKPFLSFWHDRTKPWIPILLLNSTRVEDGRRVIFSNLRISRGAKGDFTDAIGGHEVLVRQQPGMTVTYLDLPFSAAVHNSARFPYISPPGRLPNGQRLLDGGLFENSGAATAQDLYNALCDAIVERGARVQPVLIIIRFQARQNEKESPRSGAFELNSVYHDHQGLPSGYGFDGYALTELVSAPLALMNTRSARGSYSLESIHRNPHGSGGRLPSILPITFTVTENQTPLPLGWMITGRAARTMVEQMPSNKESEPQSPLPDTSTNNALKENTKAAHEVLNLLRQ